MPESTQKVTPFFMFSGEAEEETRMYIPFS